MAWPSGGVVAHGPNIPANFAPAPGVGSGASSEGRTDNPLPIGDAVASPVPGLYESVHQPPMLNDPAGVAPPGSAFTASGTPAAGAPTLSKYTLVQTPAPASSRPQSALTTSADAVALSSLFNPPLPPGLAGTGARGGASGGAKDALAAADTFGELGAAGSVLQSASGLERTRLSLAAQDIMNREAPNVPTATDSPEIRANKLAYLTKRIGSAASAAGIPASTADLARTASEITKMAGQPRLVTLGKDASGRPVEGTVDANRNFSRIAPTDETKGETQLAKLITERDTYAKAGRTDVVAQYDQAIKNFGAKYDAFGNPIGGTSAGAATPATATPAAGGALSADQQALTWANTHPQDPRAAQIKARLAAK